MRLQKLISKIGVDILKETTKRRNIYGIPIEIDNHFKLQAEQQDISVNQLYLKIIQEYYESDLDQKLSSSINRYLNPMLLKLMEYQIEILARLENIETVYQYLEEIIDE